MIRRQPSSLLLAALIVFSSCSLSQMVKMAKEQELTVTPSPLELHADTVNFDISAMLPLKMMKKNKLYTAKPSYKYGEESYSFEGIEFASSDFPNSKIEQPKIEKSFSMPYVDAMESGTLNIVGIASNLDKSKSKETEPMEIAKGVITTSRLVKDIYYVAYADHGYNNSEELIPTYVDFYFLQGSSVLRQSQVRGKSGKFLDAFIAAKNATKTVTVIGAHSPEGKETINEELANDRAEVIKKFYHKKMKQYDYAEMADSINFETKTVFQDWTPFKDSLAASSDFTEEQKSEILSKISGGGTFVEQEKSLKSLPYYSKLMKGIYPSLRHTHTVIWTIKPKKTDAEISILAKGIAQDGLNPDTLNDEELLYAVTLTPLLEEKEAICKAAVKKNDSWVSHNNLGAVYLEMAEKTTDAKKKSDLVTEAINEFKISLSKEENAEATNNLAAAYMLRGVKEDALLTFIKANSLPTSNPELKQGINAGKGSMEIKFAKYDNAIESYTAAGEIVPGTAYNKGLAYLLKKDYNNAKSNLESAIIELGNAQAELPEDALVYYVTAVADARMSNEEELAKNLSKAIEIDSSLREKALKDLEFISYWSKESFLNAVK